MDEITTTDISIIALVIQLAGILLITILIACLRRSIPSKSLFLWSVAWFALCASLGTLFFAFKLELMSKFLYSSYFLGEYVFGYFLIAGCRSYASAKSPTRKSWFLLVPALAISFALPYLSENFNHSLIFHSLIMGIAFGWAFFSLAPAYKPGQNNFGWYVLRIGLLILSLNFFHYSLAFFLHETSYGYSFSSGYLTFNSLYDMVLESLLGFGMVIVSLEKVRLKFEEINQKLKLAHDKLEQLAHTDPLTTAFNRHAFYGFLQKRQGEKIRGCVGVFDIDNLKPINDKFGHTVGDFAISAVSSSIRKLIRSDDLLFRWGGDEFFVVLVGFNEKQARQRMKPLDEMLGNLKIKNCPEPVSVGVSVGFADFSDLNDLENSIATADAEMYQNKQQRKKLAKPRQILAA